MKAQRALAVVLCLLLLGLQSQALVHPLSHIRLSKQDTAVASSAADTPCLQCALHAGGTTAAVAAAASFHFDGAVDDVVVVFRSQRATGAPAWFRSRAPPAVLV